MSIAVRRFLQTSMFSLILLIFHVHLSGQSPLQISIDNLRKNFSLKEDTSLIRFYLELGELYEPEYPDSGLYYYREALKLTESELEKKEASTGLLLTVFKAKALRYIGNVYNDMGIYDQAIEHYLASLEQHQIIGDKKGMAYCFNNIGNIHADQGNFEKAEEYYLKAIPIYTGLGDLTGLAAAYNNIGAIEHEQERFESAIVYFLKTLEMVQQIGHKQGIANTYNNLGETYHKLGQNNKALDYYQQTLDATRELGDKFGLTMVYANLARLHVSMAEGLSGGSGHPDFRKHLEEAIRYGNLALTLAEEIGSHRMVAEASSILRQAFKAAGRYREALGYAERYIETNELIFSEDKTRALAEMQEKYESLEKEKQIDNLVFENEIAENKIRQKKNQVVFIALGLALVMLVLVFLYSRYRLKQNINAILEKKNHELQVLNATKDKFVSILAHDLKNPFSAFCNITSSLHRNFDQIDRSEQQYYLEELNRSAGHMNNMLKNMLEWATIQMKPALPADEICNTHSVVQELISALDAFARSRSIMLINQVPENCRVKANQGALTTILNNLITNAIKFSPPGKEVIIQTPSSERSIKIEVTDSGIGMSQADIDKLFRIEVDTRTIGRSEGKGTGLGLILCRELVEKMGGKIGAESSPGKGSTFFFFLPAPD